MREDRGIERRGGRSREEAMRKRVVISMETRPAVILFNSIKSGQSRTSAKGGGESDSKK